MSARALLSLALLLSVGCSTTLRVPGREVTKLRALERRPVARLSDGEQWVDVDADSRVELELADGRRVVSNAGALSVHPDGLVVGATKVRRDEVTEVVVHGRERGEHGGDTLALVLGGMLLVAVLAGGSAGLEL